MPDIRRTLSRVWTPWHLLWGLTPLPYLIIDQLSYVAGAEGCNAEMLFDGLSFVFVFMVLVFFGIPVIVFTGVFVLALAKLIRARNWEALTAWICIPIF